MNPKTFHILCVVLVLFHADPSWAWGAKKVDSLDFCRQVLAAHNAGIIDDAVLRQNLLEMLSRKYRIIFSKQFYRHAAWAMNNVFGKDLVLHKGFNLKETREQNRKDLRFVAQKVWQQILYNFNTSNPPR